MRRSAALITLLCLCHYTLFAQNRNNYQLLWEISGKDLTKPSYLFGTMHLQDKRVFDFSDAVLVKLQQSEVFAMEITPDSLMAEVFKNFEYDPDEEKEEDIRDILTAEQYDKLDKQIHKETGVSIKKMNIHDPKKIMLLRKRTTTNHKNEKITFLDAYLYNIARQENKKIIGLELVKEQLDALEDKAAEHLKEEATRPVTEEEEGKQLQQLIQVYWEGDLNKIQGYTDQYDEAIFNSLIKERNINMANRMEPLMKQNSVFTAVGAAHLPGDYGIINLLKQKGYTVTPVKAVFTGAAAKFKITPVPQTWITFTSDIHFYSVLYPSQPLPLKLKSVTEDEVQLFMYPDIGSGVYYYSMGANIAQDIPKGKEEDMLSAFTKKITGNFLAKSITEKKTIYKGYPAKDVEFFDAKHNMHIKGRLILRNKLLYVFMIGSKEKELINTEDSRKYLNSISFIPIKNPDWQTFTSTEAGFQIYTPLTLRNKLQKEENIDVEFFSTIDHIEGTEYAVFTYKYKPGTVIQSDSILLNALITAFAEPGKLVSSDSIEVAGYAGKDFSIKSQTAGFMKGKVVIRGNMAYVVLTITAKDGFENKSCNDFIESFKFIPFKQAVWKEQVEKDDNFKVTVPSDFIIETDSTRKIKLRNNYNAQNQYNGISYMVSVCDYSKYYDNSDTAIYRTIKETYKGEQDSVTSSKPVTISGIKGMEYFIKEKETQNTIRLRAVVCGNKSYTQVAYLPQNEVKSAEHEQFFKSFALLQSKKENTINKKKIDVLLKDLASTDSATAAKSKDYIYYYNFQKQDIPKLYKALDKRYSDDTSASYTVREGLLEALEKVNEASTIPFLVKLYPSVDSFSRVQMAILETISSIKTKEAFDAFVKLAKHKVPADTNYYSYSIFSPFYDTLSLTKSLYPDLFTTFRNTDMRFYVFNITNCLLDSGLLKKEVINNYIPRLIKETQNYFSAHNEETYNKSIVINMFSHFMDEPETRLYIQTLTEDKDPEIAYAAIEAQLKGSVTPSKSSIEKVATAPVQRRALYQLLKEENLIPLFPTKYCTQEAMSEGLLYEFLTEEDMSTPEKVILVKSKVLSGKDGRKGRYYLYRFFYTEDGTQYSYPALVGPQPEDKKQLGQDAVVLCDYENYGKISPDEHIKRLLEK